jgi:hypothetical protein
MQVIKIDVVKKVLDIPENRTNIQFMRLPEGRMVNMGEITPESIKVYTDTYEVFKLFNPFAEEKLVNYLIKVGEKGLIDNLVKIENDVIVARMQGAEMAGRMNERDSIRKLPWYKRLFNKF